MNSQPVRTLVCIIILMVLAAGCAVPVPQDKIDYVGEWRSSSKAMYLLILADGSVRYNRLKKGVTTSVNGPLMEFDGDDFIVGISLFKTRFVVSRPPYEYEGIWIMVVDGVELTKLGP